MKSKRSFVLGIAALSVIAIAPARAAVVIHNDFVATLNQENIKSFVDQIETLDNATKANLPSSDLTAYLTQHLADNGQFNTALHYEMPGKPPQDTTLTLTKQKYIDGMVSGQGSILDYSGKVDLQQVNIAANGLSATVKTVTHDQGKVVVPSASGAPQSLPVDGLSTCDEKLIVSALHVIQMQTASCSTKVTIAAK